MQHINMCKPCMASVRVLLWFSGFDYISEHRNVHGPRLSMISHAVDGWPHLRRPGAGISGSRSGLSIIPPAAEDTAELSRAFTPAVHSPSVFPSCPPLLAWSLWVFQPAIMALVHGSADGWPVTSYLNMDAVVCASAWWGRQKVTPLVTVTRYPSHPPKFLLWLGECVELVITRSFICKTIMTLTLSWYPWGTGLLLVIAQAKHLASTGSALNSTHSYKQTSWPLFIVALLQREVFTIANKQSSNLISKPCHVYH